MFGNEAKTSNGRPVYKPKRKAKPALKQESLSAEALAAAEAKAEAAAAVLLAELEGDSAKSKPAAKPAAKPAKMASEVDPAADEALRAVLQAAEVEGASALESLKAAISEHAELASDELVVSARRVRDRLKKKAKEKSKGGKATGSECSPVTPKPGAKMISKAGSTDLPGRTLELAAK